MAGILGLHSEYWHRNKVKLGQALYRNWRGMVAGLMADGTTDYYNFQFKS